EENIDSYFKTQTLLVILIGVFGVVLIISVFYLIKKKRMEVMG
ncbi:LPXTG-motif cell wall anchor domain-containing protein, partial [Pseudobutyrivibrio ruminis]